MFNDTKRRTVSLRKLSLSGGSCVEVNERRPYDQQQNNSSEFVDFSDVQIMHKFIGWATPNLRFPTDISVSGEKVAGV